MKITIQPTSTITEVNGVPARIWEGQTESGMSVTCFMTRIAIPVNASPEDAEAFNRELNPTEAPRADHSWPARLIL